MDTKVINMNKGSLQRLTISAMLLAISVILGLFKIPLSQVSEIRLQFLPVAMDGMLFGPLYGGIVGALSDILSYIVRPTGPFFPGFTISAAVQGVIYGLFLRRSSGMGRIIIAQAVDSIIVSLILVPVWLMMLYGNAFIPLFIARLPKVLIMFPINTILLAAVLKPCRVWIGARLT